MELKTIYKLSTFYLKTILFPSKENKPDLPQNTENTKPSSAFTQKAFKALEYGHGYLDGLNPLTPALESVQRSLNIEPYSNSSSEYQTGKRDGALTGMAIDGALTIGGGSMMSGAGACELTSFGACSVGAVPTAVIGATVATAGAVMSGQHGKNYLEAEKNSQNVEQRSSQKLSTEDTSNIEDKIIEKNKDHKYIKAHKGNELPGFPGTKKTLSKTTVQGGGKLRDRWKDNKGQIYEWDFKKGTIEKYSKNGKHHLGEFDPYTGVQVGPAKSERWVKK